MKKYIFLAIPLAFLGCAATFTYPYYAAQVPDAVWNVSGKLIQANDDSDRPDLQWRSCKPDEEGNKCVIMFIDQFEALLTDYLTTKERLKGCEEDG